MRLPKVGEKGWQVSGPVVREGKIINYLPFVDCEIVREINKSTTLGGNANLLISVNGTTLYSNHLDLFRRKPEQRDKKACPNTFAELMASYKHAGKYMEGVRSNEKT
jgi:hypothetical protein